MNYYLVYFSYIRAVPPYSEEQADKDLLRVMQKIHNTFDSKEMVHAYCWPDGTCAKYFRSELDHDEFRKYLEDKLSDDDLVSPADIHKRVASDLENSWNDNGQ